MGAKRISKSYDAIVVGAGSMGMSAGYHLASRGLKTLMIDAFDPPHGSGSHHGETRLIRHAYAGQTYVRMAQRADRLWRELETLTGEKLLERSGVLNLADPEVYSFEGRMADASAQGVETESLDAREIRYRWPGFEVPESFNAMFEPQAGYLFSERCVAAYKRAAIEAGATYLPNTAVTDVSVTGNSFAFVSTLHEVYYADNVILCAGAWFPALQAGACVPVRPVRKAVGWFETAANGLYRAGVFPGFTLGTKEGAYYGFPDIDGAGLKIGRHDGGVEWRPGDPPAPFGAYPEDEADLRDALRAFLPGAAGRLLKGTVCKYEMSPDEHFILDAHPSHPNVLLAAGFSGHGFKFASAVGEILADLTVRRQSDLDLKPFSYWRFEDTRSRIHYHI